MQKYFVFHKHIWKRSKVGITNGKHTNLTCLWSWDTSNWSLTTFWFRIWYIRQVFEALKMLWYRFFNKRNTEIITCSKNKETCMFSDLSCLRITDVLYEAYPPLLWSTCFLGIFPLQSENTQKILYSRNSGVNVKGSTVRGHGYGAVGGGAQYAASLFPVSF